MKGKLHHWILWVAALSGGALLGCAGGIVGRDPGTAGRGPEDPGTEMTRKAGGEADPGSIRLPGAENPLENSPSQPRPGGGIASPAAPLGAGYPHPTADLHGAPSVVLEEMKTLCEDSNDELRISLAGYLYRQDLADNGVFNGVPLRMVDIRRNLYVDTRTYAQPRKDGPVSYVRDGYFKLTIRTDAEWPITLYMLPPGWNSPSYGTMQDCPVDGCYPDFSALLGFDHAFLTEHRQRAPKCGEFQRLLGEGSN